jgi:glycosyltransferase involved in cell wall biosynthesis
MSVSAKVALVIDALPAIGGAEKVLMDIMELFPEAPIYSLIFNRDNFRNTPLAERRVETSFIERLPSAAKRYRMYFPLMPHAIQSFDLRGYDVILSLSYAVAHGVRVQSGQTHLSYTMTPLRYAWNTVSLDGRFSLFRHLSGPLFNWFCKWDVKAAARVDRFAAISEWIAQRSREAYQRESAVIYPPVDIDRFSPERYRGDYYITVSRLVAHKQVDLIVKAFNCLGLPLVVVGEGSYRSRLQSQAGANIHFLGFQAEEMVACLLNRARGYVCAAEEDFGIAVVEAQAAGCPVIALRKGGALETVEEGQTGMFFDEADVECLATTISEFERCRGMFDPGQIAKHARRFGKDRFLVEFFQFYGGMQAYEYIDKGVFNLV